MALICFSLSDASDTKDKNREVLRILHMLLSISAVHSSNDWSLILALGSYDSSHGLPAWQSVIETACASFESRMSAKYPFPCAFFIATWHSCFSEPIGALEITDLTLPS
ncbi:hypothetical protein Tco_1266816 [Tanacetum coccineum]